MVKIDDTANFYTRFMASDVQNKKKLNDEILYQLFRRVKPERKDIAATISNPPDHTPNQIHQIDTLYMPEDNGVNLALTVVDTGSRLTDCEPIKGKKSIDALNALKRIYNRPKKDRILEKPSVSIEVDDGSEFKADFKAFFGKEKVYMRVAQPGRSRQQGLVENRNGLIGRTLMRRMVAEELLTGSKSVEWIHYLPKLIAMMNEKYYLKPIDMKPAEVMAEPKTDRFSSELLNVGQKVRVQLDKPINLLNKKRLHGKFREGDAKFSLDTYTIDRIQVLPNQPVFYKLKDVKGKLLKPLYTKHQLLVVSENSKMPPRTVQHKFIIEKVLDKKKMKGLIHFLVKWKGYSDEHNSWEPRKELINTIPALLEEYETQHD